MDYFCFGKPSIKTHKRSVRKRDGPNLDSELNNEQKKNNLNQLGGKRKVQVLASTVILEEPNVGKFFQLFSAYQN